MSTTIAQSVANLQTDLNNIKIAVRNKGGSIDSNAGFSSVSSAITNIPAATVVTSSGKLFKKSYGHYIRTGYSNSDYGGLSDCYTYYRYASDQVTGSDVHSIEPYVPNIWNLPVGEYPCAWTIDACTSYNANIIVYEWQYTNTAGNPVSGSKTISGITHIKIVSTYATNTIQYSTDYGQTWESASCPTYVNVPGGTWVAYSRAAIYIKLQTIEGLTSDYSSNEIEIWDPSAGQLVPGTLFNPEDGVYRVVANKQIQSYSDFYSNNEVYVMIDGGTIGHDGYTLGIIKDA